MPSYVYLRDPQSRASSCHPKHHHYAPQTDEVAAENEVRLTGEAGYEFRYRWGNRNRNMRSPPCAQVSRFIFEHTCRAITWHLRLKPKHIHRFTLSHSYLWIYLFVVWLSPLGFPWLPSISRSTTLVLIMLIATNVMAILARWLAYLLPHFQLSLPPASKRRWLKHLFALDISKVITQISCHAHHHHRQPQE